MHTKNMIPPGSPPHRSLSATNNYNFENESLHKYPSAMRSGLDTLGPSLKNAINALSSSRLINQNTNMVTKNNQEVGTNNQQMTGKSPIDFIMAKLNEKKAILVEQGNALDSVEGMYLREHTSSSNSLPNTTATDDFSNTAPSTRPASAAVNNTQNQSEEVLQLKFQLAQAQCKISSFKHELACARGYDVVEDEAQASGPRTGMAPQQQPQPMPMSVNVPVCMPMQRENSSGGAAWAGYNDGRSDVVDGMVSTATSGALNRGPRQPWGFAANNSGFQNPASFQNSAVFQNSAIAQHLPVVTEPGQGAWFGGRGAGHHPIVDPSGGGVSLAEGYRNDRMTPEPHAFVRPHVAAAAAAAAAAGGRNRAVRYPNNNYNSRYLSPARPFNSGNGSVPYNGSNNIYGLHPAGGSGHFDGAVAPSMAMTSAPLFSGTAGPMTVGPYGAYHQPQPIGTPLSPHATEFTTTTTGVGWRNEQPMSTEVTTYLAPTEPLNYRRLLDRSVSCNWKYIVDKIVCNNDQQASIFLQQKLKVSTPEQKYEIVEAIVAQAYALMVNRFGNFLVQRCFEHGTPEQVIKIAEAIRGHTLNLSMDPFGCHVVQKAFDSVPEDYKAIMVHELLRRIPETVVHRYACHVWQKLFELRWQESPPQIMRFVNDALRGMWHEVALGETGSLVVQNIFENCLEEDKRPCIEEVLANIDIVAHGQFGNWCIQHICEHGAPADRSRAVDHVIRYAAEYSTDQFASKVVEKCLKIGRAEFLARYLERVCEGRPDRPRIPLIDISSDQYGNYLIQYILTHASPAHRDMVQAHIRKHMVSLRGSKFGSRVGMLCNNPAVTTRPGPGVGPGMGGGGGGGGGRMGGGGGHGSHHHHHHHLGPLHHAGHHHHHLGPHGPRYNGGGNYR